MENEKYVDEGWKESVAKEKERTQVQPGSQPPPSQQASVKQEEPVKSASPSSSEPVNSSVINFVNYISSLVYQAMIFLGEVPNPVTEEIEENPEQAKFIVDTLILLREKTKGNLTKQESDLLNGSLYELQMKFVEKSQKSSSRSS